MKEFCQRLTQLRKDYGFTQKMMAEKLQIRQPSYIRYEKGTAEPSLTSLKILAEVFDVSVDYLLGRADI